MVTNEVSAPAEPRLGGARPALIILALSVFAAVTRACWSACTR